MLKDLSAIPLRPHPDLKILPSQLSPPVIRSWRNGSPQISTPLQSYNFDPPMLGSRSPYSARRDPATPRQLKTPKTPQTPQTTPSRHSMSRKSFGTLARRLSSLTSRQTVNSPETSPPIPPPYQGLPLFSLISEASHPPEPLVLGSYPQFSPSSFFQGFDTLRTKVDDDDEALLSNDARNDGDVFVGPKGLGLSSRESRESRENVVPIRLSPSNASLPSPPPTVRLPPNPQPLFTHSGLFDAGVIEAAAEGPLSDGFLSDNRQSFDLGPMLFGSSVATESYGKKGMPPVADTSLQRSYSLESVGLGYPHASPSPLDSQTTYPTIPTIPSLPLDRPALSTHELEHAIYAPSLPAPREVDSFALLQRTSYIAPHPQHASPHLCMSPLPADASLVFSRRSPPMPVSPLPSENPSRPPSSKPGRDPLEELIAVAAELKSMVRPPSLSGRIMLQTPSPAFTSTGPPSPVITEHLDAKMLAAEFEALGERVLEVRVHGEDVPAIVVVRPDSIYSLHAHAFYPGGAEPIPGAEPDAYLLAPPLADERGRVDWYGREQEGLPAYEYAGPLSLLKPSLQVKCRLHDERPTLTESPLVQPVHPVQHIHTSLGRKRNAGQKMVSPPTVRRERVLTIPLQGPHSLSKGALRTPPLASPTPPSEPLPTRNKAITTPHKGSFFKRALRIASGDYDVDPGTARSRNRNQTGYREATWGARTISESVRSRGGRTESGRANWRTLFERGAGKPGRLLIPGKEAIGSPRPLSPVTQWGCAEQGVLVGVL